MAETKAFEIFYQDLTESAQHYLCKAFKTTPEEENWDVCPLAIVEKEEDGTK